MFRRNRVTDASSQSAINVVLKLSNREVVLLIFVIITTVINLLLILGVGLTFTLEREEHKPESEPLENDPLARKQEKIRKEVARLQLERFTKQIVHPQNETIDNKRIVWILRNRYEDDETEKELIAMGIIASAKLVLTAKHSLIYKRGSFVKLQVKSNSKYWGIVTPFEKWHNIQAVNCDAIGFCLLRIEPEFGNLEPVKIITENLYPLQYVKYDTPAKSCGLAKLKNSLTIESITKELRQVEVHMDHQQAPCKIFNQLPGEVILFGNDLLAMHTDYECNYFNASQWLTIEKSFTKVHEPFQSLNYNRLKQNDKPHNESSQTFLFIKIKN